MKPELASVANQMFLRVAKRDSPHFDALAIDIFLCEYLLMDDDDIASFYNANRIWFDPEFENRTPKVMALYAKAIDGYSSFAWYVPRACICLRNP